MRRIKYRRYEFHDPDPEERKAPLFAFVYDVPYLGCCGIFPPRHILNWILEQGGSTGGMGPGATWEPFSVDQQEYDELWSILDTLDPQSLGETARYTIVKFKRDSTFDHITDWREWIHAVAEKHRDTYRRVMQGSENEDVT